MGLFSPARRIINPNQFMRCDPGEESNFPSVSPEDSRRALAAPDDLFFNPRPSLKNNIDYQPVPVLLPTSSPEGTPVLDDEFVVWKLQTNKTVRFRLWNWNLFVYSNGNLAHVPPVKPNGDRNYKIFLRKDGIIDPNYSDMFPDLVASKKNIMSLDSNLLGLVGLDAGALDGPQDDAVKPAFCLFWDDAQLFELVMAGISSGDLNVGDMVYPKVQGWYL
jgi:hypothetical protein